MRNSLQNRRIVSALLIGVFAAACNDAHPNVPFYRTAALTPEWLGKRVTDNSSFHHVASFRLTDQDGKTITSQSLDHRVSIIHFFFTRCAGVCPTTHTNLARLLATMPNESRLQVLSHSVMPESDSVSALRMYASLHNMTDVRWRLLTGERSSIERLARESYFVNLSNGSSYGVKDLAHTETLVLIDSRGRLRGVYTGSLRLDIDKLGEDIKAVLAEAA
ncbi:MAG: SCO family protein [Gemmatimonadaceae bacterium]